MDGWVECSLCEADEEAAGVELVGGLHSGGGKGYENPEELPAGTPEGRTDTGAD